MDFKELIADFAERHSISDLAAEDNAAALNIDGIVITLVAFGDTLSVSAEIGEPPSEGRAEFAELLLEANLQSDSFFAKAAESGTYILVRRLALPTLESEAFDAALEALVNLAETWRRLLDDFRPSKDENDKTISHDEVLAIKNAFVRALAQNGVGQIALNDIRRRIGLAPDNSLRQGAGARRRPARLPRGRLQVGIRGLRRPRRAPVPRCARGRQDARRGG